MVKVGDQIRLSSGKGPDREGVVTAVAGSLVGVRWPSGEETTVVPAPGTLTVLAPAGDQAVRRERAAPERAAAKKAPAKKAAAKKAVAKKAPAKKAAAKKAVAKKAPAKKAPAKKAPAKKAPAKKASGIKRSSH